jgi:hypothetical protein
MMGQECRIPSELACIQAACGKGKEHGLCLWPACRHVCRTDVRDGALAVRALFIRALCEEKA